MKYIKLFIFSFVITACCSHRSMTTESRILSLDSAVTNFTTNYSINTNRFDSIISSLEVTIDYKIFNDSTKEKKIEIHARKEQSTRENGVQSADSSRFFIHQNKQKEEKREDVTQKRFYENEDFIVVIFMIVLIICFFLTRKWH